MVAMLRLRLDGRKSRALALTLGTSALAMFR
jgi:hypothetical protein